MKFTVKGDAKYGTVERGGQSVDLSSGSYETDDPSEVAWLSGLDFLETDQPTQAAATSAQVEAEEQVEGSKRRRKSS